jgi:hypothetical protein
VQEKEKRNYANDGTDMNRANGKNPPKHVQFQWGNRQVSNNQPEKEIEVHKAKNVEEENSTIKKYCEQLLLTTKREVDKRIEEVNERLERSTAKTAEEISKLEKVIDRNRRESDETGRINKEDNKKDMETILKNQQAMMDVLLNRMDKLNDGIKIRNTESTRNDGREYDDEKEIDKGSKENKGTNGSKIIAEVDEAWYLERTATPPEINMGRGKYRKPLAEQQQ